MMARRLVISALAALILLSGGVARAQTTTPTLTATAAGGGPIDQAFMEDRATLSDSDAATGTLTFTLYGPDDPDCLRAPSVLSSVDVTGNGMYLSDPTWPDAVGTYAYVARYEGDDQNDAVATTCGDPSQSLTVTRAAPTLVTTSTSSAPTGGEIVDTARLTGYAPGGSIAFDLYAPDDTSCAQPPIFRSTIPLDGGERYTSNPYTPTQPGIYRWIASYDGDARNEPVAGVCGDDGESTTVTASMPPLSAAPTVSLRGSPATAVGGQISATAALSTSASALGTLTFRVYGPDDDTCRRGAVAASTRSVVTGGDYTSDPFTPQAPGVYRFVVDYNGGDGTAATRCDEPAAAIAVSPAPGPVPVLDKSFTVALVSGSVSVKLPTRSVAGRTAHASALGFVEVHEERTVPVESTVDTRFGTVRLKAASRGAAIQTSVLRGSRFVVHQRAADPELVVLDARSPAAAPQGCGRQGRPGRVARRRKPPSLHAKVRGQFETIGAHSQTAAHGTEWQVTERCDGTFTHVISGVVTVTDFRLHRSVRVRARGNYLARTRR